MDNTIFHDDNGRLSASHGSAVRRMNLQAALNVLHDLGPLTSPQICPALNIYPSTTNRLMATLQDAGLVVTEAVIANNSVGRPPKIWCLNYDAGYIVGLHVAPAMIRGILIDFTGQIRRQETQWHTPNLTTRNLPDAIARFVHELVDGVPEKSIYGIGIGMTGVVDPTTGTVIRSGGLFDERGNSAMQYPLGELLTVRLPWQLQIANDANVGALASFKCQLRKGLVQAQGSLLYLLLSPLAGGVGSGFFMGGKLYSGAHGAAGEIMHPKYALTDPDISEQAKFAEDGDEAAIETVLNARLPMLEALVGLCQSLDPDCVVLGGDFAILQPHVTTLLRKLLNQTPGYWGYVEEQPAAGLVNDELWPNTVAIGAADLVLDTLFCEPSPNVSGPLVSMALSGETSTADVI